MQREALFELLKEKIKPKANLKVRIEGEKRAYSVRGVDRPARKILVDLPDGIKSSQQTHLFPDSATSTYYSALLR
jgi:hypothetical protein